MPERQSRHGDNKLIDEPVESNAQQGSSGGELGRDVGKRAEEKAALKGDAGVERVHGQDDPEADRKKGPKAISRMRGGG